jgi:hypothetical protein
MKELENTTQIIKKNITNTKTINKTNQSRKPGRNESKK